ncbi:MAG: 4Fe-4S dicluster domain-containing protein [Acidimicrobiales bacterium]
MSTVLQVLRFLPVAVLVHRRPSRRRRPKVTAAETEQVMDECFQCKLCEVQCPYTVRDSHEYQLDFPKLVHRFKAQRTRERARSPCETRCSVTPTAPPRPPGPASGRPTP